MFPYAGSSGDLAALCPISFWLLFSGIYIWSKANKQLYIAGLYKQFYHINITYSKKTKVLQTIQDIQNQRFEVNQARPPT